MSHQRWTRCRLAELRFRCSLPWLVIGMLLAQFCLCGIGRSEDPLWRAGAAKIDITPDQPMWMAGYGKRDRPASGELSRLWAKALVIEDAAANRGLLITLDLVGIDRKLSAAICSQLADRLHLERKQIAIATSHTHSGPVVGRNLAPLHYLLVDSQQQALIDAYAAQLQRSIVSVAESAVQKLAPAQLSWGSGRSTFATNRRNNPSQTVVRRRADGQLNGPYDHDVPVLAVRDSAGALKAVLFGYACHATVLDSYDWSGDYPGVAQRELEADHPDCVALFFAGCGADQNPLPRRTVALVEHYGQRLATAVNEVLLTLEMSPVRGELKTSYQEIELPLDTLPTLEQISSDAKSGDKYVRARAQMLKEQLASGGSLSATYPYPIGGWHLGDEVQLVFLGGEVVVDYALRLKSELTGVRTWVAGYANDVMAYIPSRRVLREGGYEGGGAMVYYGLPTVWSPEVEEAIIGAAKRSLAR